MSNREEELRQLCLGYTEKIMHLRLDLLALQTCLIDKGVITPADLGAAVQKVHRESKTALKNLQDAAEAKTEKQN
jgi:hypothetical protein